MTILEVTAVWSGFAGAPGYSNFHFTNAGVITTAVDNSVAAVHDFFQAITAVFSTTTHIQVQQDVKEFDPATGALVGLHSAGSVPGLVTGSGSDALGPSPAGLCVNWGTSGINRGRKVRGRTFLVPLALNAYEADGSVQAAKATTVANAATAYRTSAAYETLIWSRPRAGAGGAAFPIVSSSCPRKAAVLRSRRD